MMDIQNIKELALVNGFKLKEQASGNMDLNAYVYDFANAVEQAVKAQSEKALLEQFEINNKLVEQIEKLKAQAVPEWISVEDRMPEHGQKVLVFRPDAHNHPYKDPNFKICTYAGADIFINSHFEHAITHWKPITAPVEVKEPAND